MMSKMIGKITWTIKVITLIFSLGAVHAAQDYLSPEAIVADADGKTLYVAEATADQIAVVDVASEKCIKTIPLPASPNGLAIRGNRLFVAAGGPNGKLLVVDIEDGKAKGELDVGHTPSAVVVSGDGKTIYVCNKFDDSVSVVDATTKKQIAVIPVSREPIAAALTSDGATLFVANLLPAGAADADYSSAVVSVIDTASKKVEKTISLPNGSMGLRDVVISPDGKNAYVTHILGRYQLPTTQLERGWINTNALSVIDAADKKLINTVLLDDVDLGAANPWGLTCSADGKNICVALAGTHEVAVIDRAGMHEKLDRAAKGEKVSDASSSADDVPNDLAFLVGLKKRLKLTGNGPRGIVLIGSKAYVSEYFTDTVGVVDIFSKARRNAKSIALGPKKELTAVRRGEMYFHDADLCFQKWQSCTSCHPSEGRPDALNWDLLNDGLGNPKNTKSLLLAHQTPPAMVTGVRENAEIAVRAGIRHIQFAVRPEEDASAIDEYLKSLKPVPSPKLVKGRLSEAAKRGQKLFNSAGCVQCHPAPLYTDMNKYDVGTGILREKGLEYDTPTLVEVWRTAPYLHDGRAVTIEEVLGKFNKNDKHGSTSGLSDSEIKDLAEFILSL